MARVTLAALAVAILVLLQPAASIATPDRRFSDAVAAQEVGWPVSSDLLVAEVVTGGASASDEYVELTNASTVPFDLEGLELAYVTSTGSTVTRKASWDAPLVVEPGRHVLLANSLGIYAAVADATYSGGFSATGGTVVLRPVGGAPIDSVSWGTAASEFVEGLAAPAPPAGSSIERRPGGIDGNTVDSNDNAADLLINELPEARNLAADPLPPVPTPTPTPTAPPSPSPTPTPTPTPEPPVVESISAARLLPDDTWTTIQGVLTTSLGALEGGRTAFVQDETGGIALYLDATVALELPAGTVIRTSGTLANRYGQRTLRIAEVDVDQIGWSDMPPALPATTGGSAEPLEGRRINVSGVVTEAPTSLSDGLGLTVDDGTGPLRVVAVPEALGTLAVTTGSTVRAQGPLGQRDSSGAGSSGYRLYVTLPGELVLLTPEPSPTSTPPGPTPTPGPTQSPAGTPSPSPEATPSPAPTPSATPAPSPVAMTIASARVAAVGTQVAVRGVVIAEAGRLGTPPLFAIADSSAGVVVRLPDGVAAPARGTLLEVRGRIVDPYGQVEIRPEADAINNLGSSELPQPLVVALGAVGERTEGQLAVVSGEILTSATRSTSGDLAFTIGNGDDVTLSIRADASAGLDRTLFRKGMHGSLIGVVGQRASRKGRLDGYRLWLRDSDDVALSAAPVGSPPAGGQTAAPTAATAPSKISVARVRVGNRVVVEGVLTVGRTLLDTTGRRTIVEDASGAIEVYLRSPDPKLRSGQLVRVTGTVGRAWNAPRLKADDVTVIGARQPVAHILRGRPSAATEWSLVRVSGSITDIRRSGDRWTADLETAGGSVLVQGLAGSGIASSAVVEGRVATITGIVKRPYPTATDRRFSVVPRGPSDVALGPGAGTQASAASALRRAGGGTAGAGAESLSAQVIDIDLRDLASNVGRVVRVGGLVTVVGDASFGLDDGTAVRGVVLEGTAATMLARLHPGDALNATGTPEDRDEPVLVVSDAAAIDLAADLTPTVPGVDADGVPVGASGAGGAGGGERPAALALGASTTGSATPSTLPMAIAIGLLLMVAVSTTGTALLRRRHLRRRLEARISDRLSAIRSAGQAAPEAVSPPPAVDARGPGAPSGRG
jgi:hypothetical protein